MTPRRRWESSRQEPTERGRDGKRIATVGGRHCTCEGAAHRLGLSTWHRAAGGHQVAAPASETPAHFDPNCPHSLLRWTTTEHPRHVRRGRPRVHVPRRILAID